MAFMGCWLTAAGKLVPMEEGLTAIAEEYDMPVAKAVAMVRAMLLEFNPSGDYIEPRFWNRAEDREATLREVFEAMDNR